MTTSHPNTTQNVISIDYEELYEYKQHHLQYLYDISVASLRYGKPCVWILGIIGNALAIAIFSRKSMRSSLTGYLFLWLAIFDMLSISNGIFDFINSFEIDIFPLIYSKVFCKIYLFVIHSFTSVAAYVLVGITIERLIGVSMPHKAKQFCTIHNGKIYMSVLIPVCFAIHIPYILAVGVIIDEYGTFCDDEYNMSMKYFMVHIFPWIRALSYNIMPFCIMLLCNIVIIYKLIRATKDRNQSVRSTSDGPNIANLTAMLIGVSLTFIICTFLTFLISVLDIVSWYAHFADDFGFYMEVLMAYADILSAVNHSINFYIYALTGPRFRKELVVMCGCTCLCH